jgi:hypothetical protein
MFQKMTHLGPHTHVSEDSHHAGDQWIDHFTRDERHRLVEEDQFARNSVGAVVFGCMLSGLMLVVGLLLAGGWRL